MYVETLTWLAALVGLGLVALPLTAAVLAPLAGRGAGFAFTVGVAALAVLTLWAGQLHYGAATAWGAVVGVGALSAVALSRGVAPPWRRFGEATLVVAAAFLLGVAVRSTSPALEIWAEGYLNFGLVKSLLRAETLPPTDMWFAGEPVQYYYGGHLIAATVARVLGVSGEIVPNLAVPTFFALLVVGAYELGGSLGVARGVPRRLAGGLSALLLGAGGNLYEPLRQLLELVPTMTAVSAWAALGLDPRRLGDTFSAFAPTHFAPFPTDVPVYSLQVGSLHAHVTSQPFTLLVAAIALAGFRTPGFARRRRWARIAIGGVVVGLVAVINLWSLPTAAALVGLAVAFAPDHPGSLLPEPHRRRLRTWRRGHVDPDARPVANAASVAAARYGAGVLVALVALAVGLAVAAPFVLRTDASRPIALFPLRSTAAFYVVSYGWLLAAFALFLGPRIGRALLEGRRGAAVVAIVLLTGLVVAASRLAFPALALVAPIGLASWWLLRKAIDVPPAGVVDEAFSHDDSADAAADTTAGVTTAASERVGFETVLVLAGAGLALLVELAYVRDGAAVGRYNTAYKVFSQVWLLWTLAAGAILARVLWDAREHLAEAAHRWHRFRDAAGTTRLRRTLVDRQTAMAIVAALLVAAVVLAGVTYGALAMTEGLVRNPDQARSLDATAFVADRDEDVAAAVAYLDARPGQPTIVEAVPTEVEVFSLEANPFSSLTGLPTVAGWTHAADYHGREAYEARADDVSAIYEGDRATRHALLDRYDVRYVVVGHLEHKRYIVENLAADPALTARPFGEVTVYVVDQDALMTRADPPSADNA